MTKSQKQFGKFSKYSITLVGILVIVFVYFMLGARGDTTVGVTLRTNSELEDGLILHWTFDGKDMDWTQTDAEVRDSSGNGNHGDAVFPPND